MFNKQPGTVLLNIESGSYAELIEQKGYFYEMKQIERQMFDDMPAARSH
ncbi:hypothetical protein [Paenibacillus dokdonensis]